MSRVGLIDILNEFQMEPSLKRKINEFGKLNDEIDSLKYKLNKLTKDYKVIEQELRPLLEELQRHGEESVMTEKYLVSIKQGGYERINYSYKKGFEKSLTKVNTSTRKLLEDLLKTTETITYISSKVGVQKLSESSFIKRFFTTILTLIKKVVPSIRRNKKDLSSLNKLTKRMMGM